MANANIEVCLEEVLLTSCLFHWTYVYEAAIYPVLHKSSESPCLHHFAVLSRFRADIQIANAIPDVLERIGTFRA